MILVFDLSRPKTFANIKFWKREITNECSENVKIVLVGNKLDLVEENKIEDVKKHEKYGLKVFYSSAKLGHQIQDPFLFLAQ